MRIILTAAALAALCACGSRAAPGPGAEIQALITALEDQVSLPDASRPLSGYERYYAVSGNEVAAVYLAAPDGAGEIHLVQPGDLPEAKDGGCAVVNVVFDRSSDRFQRILCNELRLTEAQPALKPGARRGSRGERG